MTLHRQPWLDTPWEPEALREQPLEELLDRSVQYADATEGLFDKLGAIRSSTSDAGVSVTVTLDGQLVGLTLTDEAIGLGGAKLAETIHRLTNEAAAEALNRGIATLTPVVGIDIAEQLAAATGLNEAKERAAAAASVADVVEEKAVPAPARPARPRRPAPVVDEEDFSTLETWAVRD